MKKINSLYIASSVLLFFAVSVLSSCGGKDSPSASEVNQGILSSGTWKISNVTVDGVDQTSLFTGLTLQFTASSYTTTNGDPVWPATGTWSFTDDTATSVKRSDGVIVGISSISETGLVLTLDWTKTTLGTGRVKSVAGAHVFTFTK